MRPAAYEDVWRESVPHVLGALVRRYGDLGSAEDAVQEALLAAARQWPDEGMPDNPRGWLVRVASRRLVDQLRSDRARAERELRVAVSVPDDVLLSPAADDGTSDRDDSLVLLLLCCHPALTPPSQVALTLRAVGGLSTAQVARAFLVPEATMAQRISRAKATLSASGVRFSLPVPAEMPARVDAVCQVLYLVFSEGHTASTGAGLVDTTLATEAMRLTRVLHAALPAADEVTGLLALMLLTDARRAARTTDDGALVPLAEQDRSLWDAAAIAEGVRLVEGVLPSGRVGPYQLQAAIAAVHAEAPHAAATDWPQVLALYDLLVTVAPGPAVTLNRAVAVAEVEGPAAGLVALQPLLADRSMQRHHRLHAVRGHLLAATGDASAAHEAFATAARLATSLPEQRYLLARAASSGTLSP